jgi:UDP-N-acetyl-2-amino-2-deoxyglucuronate dehydrogenase
MKRFGLIGAAGFIAPRHLKAIKDTGNHLVAALDKHDCVGIMDSYFPEADFFTEFERFDRHVDKLRRQGQGLDYISICSPNYLHDAHIRFALRQGAHAICEKPLVLNPWNVEAIVDLEKETGLKVNTILQLRLHPAVIALREQVKASPKDKIFEVDLGYITSRGRWYHISWKGDTEKSGSISTNIGIHFFDMLIWIFGPVLSFEVHANEKDHASGFITLQGARVRWFLSINEDHIPSEIRAQGKRTFRSLEIEGKAFEFSEGFTELHTLSYQEILNGNGFGAAESGPSIRLAHDIRNAEVSTSGDFHPLFLKVKKQRS